MRIPQKSCLLLAVLAAFALPSIQGCAPPLVDKAATPYRDQHLSADTVWSGRIVIDGTVKVAKGATLTILPGTEVAFVRRDDDRDGLGDAVLAVEGRLIAVGTRRQPIRFHSAAANPQPGDWLEIRVDFSQDVHLRYCDIRDSAYTLHAHFTRGVVEDCTIHHNIDGCRLGQASFVFRNNLVEHNQGKGINFRNSSVDVHHNIVRFNGSGIFLFENDRDVAIHHNNLYENLDNFRLGDFYAGDVELQDNWWGSAELERARATIYDRSRDPEIGQVSIRPAGSWIAASGPRDALELVAAWQHTTAGYVDADPVAAGDRLYLASWDGTLRALDREGALLWSRKLGDTIDATPLLSGQRLFVQTWSREVYAVDAEQGTVRWRFDYSPSQADDHRQAGLQAIDDLVLVPAWNGTLFALDAASGERRWSYSAGQPLRARPAADAERIFLAGGDGVLSVLTHEGTLLWKQTLGAPLLGTPALIPDGVAVLSRDGRLSAFGLDGRPLWERDLAEPCFYAAPIHHDGALFVATAGNGLWKLSAATGAVVWRAGLVGPSYATPLVADGRLFVGDNSGALQVFGVDSGDLLAKLLLEREIQGRPLLWGDQLLVGGRDHKVHAFRLLEPPGP